MTTPEEIYIQWESWMESLSIIPAQYPLSLLFKLKNSLLILHSLLLSCRWSFIAVFVSDKTSLTSLFLGSYYMFLGEKVGRVTYVCATSFALHVFLIQVCCLKNRPTLHQIIMKKLIPLNIQGLVTIMTITRLFLLATMTSVILFASGCIYLAILDQQVIVGNKLITDIVWIAYGIVYMIEIYICLNQMFAIFALWLAGKSHLAYQVDKIIAMVHDISTQHQVHKMERVSQCIQNKMREKVFDIHIRSLTKEFNDLCILVSKFNLFSKEILFLMTSTISFLNACLFCQYFILIKEKPLLGCSCLFSLFEFMVGSVYLLNVGSSLDKKSKILYRTLNCLYASKARSSGITKTRKRLLILIKSLGSKAKPFSLVNIDGQVFDKVLLCRYLIYSVRMFVFAINFAYALDH